MYHYHHSPVMKLVCTLSWLLVSIGAINWGLDAAGYNLFESHFVMANLGNFIQIFKYIIGACGVVSLFMLFDHLRRASMGEECKC